MQSIDALRTFRHWRRIDHVFGNPEIVEIHGAVAFGHIRVTRFHFAPDPEAYRPRRAAEDELLGVISRARSAREREEERDGTVCHSADRYHWNLLFSRIDRQRREVWCL